MSCPRCGSVNPVKGSVCIWCHAKLPGRLQRSLRGRPSRVVVAAMALAVVAVLAYYAYSRGPEAVARAPAAGEAGLVNPATSPRADRQSAETPKPKTASAAAARPQTGGARKAEPATTGTEACTDASAALGLCGRANAREPPRPQNCTEAVAALGLCEHATTQRRE